MHIAICFFGLTRSLQYTKHSITNIFEVLDKNDITYTTFLHTYDKSFLSNPRSNEFDCKLDIEEYKLLNCHHHSVTNQESFLSSLPKQYLQFLKIKGDAWKDQYVSFTNFLCQLNSLQIVTSMWKSDDHSFDLIMYLRPDLLYNELVIDDLYMSIRQQCIFTPNYHQCTGLNDRIAIGPPQLMVYYGNRFQDLLEYAKNRKVHSESFLKYIVQKHNLHHQSLLQLKGKRIRANGQLCLTDENIF